MFWFGTFLGLLTAVSTAAGTTVTLIGLLFTLVGGSLLAWYRPDALTGPQRTQMVGHIGAIGKGGLTGLLVGFAFQFTRDFWIAPAIYQKYKEIGLPAPPIPKPPELGKTFTTQASKEEFEALARDIEADAKTSEKLSADEKKALATLAQYASGVAGLFQNLQEKGTRDRMSDNANRALDKVIKASP